MKIKTFKTEDGYKFYLIKGTWFDNVNPDEADMSLPNGENNRPVFDDPELAETGVEGEEEIS